MAGKLFSLFDEKLKTAKDLVSSKPQNLESISLNKEDQEFILKKIKNFEEVKPKVDYSDFSNFVFFNSAVDYFAITAEKILNEYPYDGSNDLIQSYLDDLDDYQKYVVSVWAKRIGHLRFDPSVSTAYISVEDVGLNRNTKKTTIGNLSPGTGSFSIDFWCIPPPVLTGSNDVMFVGQKISGSNQDGYSIYFSGSNLYFKVTSGSFVDQVSSKFNPSSISYFSCLYDKSLSTPLISIVSGSTQEFPVIVSSASITTISRMDLGGSNFYIGSGTLSGKVTRGLTGSLDDYKFWNLPRTIFDLSGTFNIRQYAQPGLVANWAFNESGSVFPVSINPENFIVLDSSGYKLNGRIQNYFSSLRASGSLLPYDKPDLILSVNAPEIQSYVLQQYTSASDYDKNNDNLIKKLLPEQFFLIEEERNTKVLENFLYIIARNFDYIKVRIEQFVNVLRQNYGEFNQTPDALLADVGKFFGWEFTGNFLSTDVNQYILGKNILHNTDNNKEIEKKLYEIKNEFWKRTLLNLIYIYKTKSTRESIESLLRVYGLDKNFVKLKEYGFRPNVGITTERISVEKSVPVLTFGSASFTGSYVVSNLFSSSIGAVECRVKFPTTASTGLFPSVSSGSIWTLAADTGSAGFPYGFYFMFGEPHDQSFYQLKYHKAAYDSYTGSLILTSSEGNVQLDNIQLFDNRWYNISFNRDHVSSSLNLEVRGLDRDEIDVFITGSTSSSLGNNEFIYSFWLGATGSYKAEYWAQEFRVWDEKLSKVELDDHCLNFQSYGTEEFNDNYLLKLHWRLAENITSSAGVMANSIIDVSTNNVVGSGFNFNPTPYRKFLNEYNYIASPEYGWTEQLVRVLDSSEVKGRDAFTGNRLLSLEFNMIDALNEDISQIIATLDNFNYAIGLPVSKYRNQYEDLRILRNNYFKRLQGRLNFRVFADMLEFFDRSFIDLVRRLIPAHSIFIGDQFVVESHMLERPKIEWGFHRQEKHIELQAVINLYNRS